MSPAQKKRLKVILSLVTGLGVSMALVLYALSKNINLFYTPTQLAQEKHVSHQTLRVGGMVVKESVVRSQDLNVEFVITDFNQQVKVKYRGILPDLFREGQGIVAQGQLEKDGTFIANQVLAKHDEKYMPPEVTAALKEGTALAKKGNES